MRFRVMGSTVRLVVLVAVLAWALPCLAGSVPSVMVRIVSPTEGQAVVLGRPLTIDWNADVSCTAFRLSVLGRSGGAAVADVRLPGDARGYTIPVVASESGLRITLEWWAGSATGRVAVNTGVAGHIGVPGILSPTNGSIVPPGDLDVRWKSVKGAQYYVITVRDNTTGGNVTGPARINGTTTRVRGVPPGHRVTVIVGAVSLSPETMDEVSVSVVQPTPQSPRIISPRDGERVMPGALTLRWTQVKDAEWYRVLAVDTTAGGAVLLDTRTTTVGARVPDLVGGHFVRVSVTAGNGAGETPSAVTFEVKHVRPAAPTVLSPARNAKVPAGALTVQWAPVANALEYRVTVTDGAGAVLVDTTTTSTSVSFGGTVAGQRLRITVAASNPAGSGSTIVNATIV